MNIIEAHNLSKKYGDFAAVKNISFAVKKGSVFGFLGHNGAGKTTTLNMLTTLLIPTSGEIQIAGIDAVEHPFAVKEKIGYLPENVQLYNSFTAFENLEFFAKLSGIKNPKSAVLETLEFLGSLDYKDKKIGELSKGMRQRIGIAQAVLHSPEVLFLDEPTAGLDPLGIMQLRDIIAKLNQERGVTIFMNTHLLSEVVKTCDSIGILNHGKLLFSDTVRSAQKRFGNDKSLEDIYFLIEQGVNA
ncbi:MAG: ABC transporter ATP-binding protein [Patescibacteria group bacterium]